MTRLLKVDPQTPVADYCQHCNGTGTIQALFLPLPINCMMCGGSGLSAASRTSAPARPGIGDELKPELISKRLRDW